MENTTWLLIFCWICVIGSLFVNERHDSALIISNSIFIAAWFIVTAIEGKNGKP